jgi:preprotein translocase subunit YajC
VQINIQGLSAGQAVLITETFDRRGNLTITFKLVPAANPNGDDQEATGTIVATDEFSLTIETDDGRSMAFQASTELLDGLELGDQVDVTYYSDADGTLVADDIELTELNDDPGNGGLDAIGTVSAIDVSSITVQLADGGMTTFEADADLLEGFSVGDQVDVSYYQDTDGLLVADDIEPLDG